MAIPRVGLRLSIGLSLLAVASSAAAYDGTKCKEPGVCWEPKPGYPAKVAGSKYDPKHDPKEVAKQELAHKAMDERNEKRWKHFQETGVWKYDVK